MANTKLLFLLSCALILCACNKTDYFDLPEIEFGDSEYYKYVHDTLVINEKDTSSLRSFDYRIRIKLSRGTLEVENFEFKTQDSIHYLKLDTTVNPFKIDTIKIVHTPFREWLPKTLKQVAPFSDEIFVDFHFNLIKGSGYYKWQFRAKDLEGNYSNVIEKTIYLRQKF